MAEGKNDKEINGRGGMLSSSDFRLRVINREKDADYTELKELFESRQWDELGKKKKERGFIIDPYDVLNLTPYTYDLAIGDEAFSCRLESPSSFALGDEENPYKMQPGETVIVRTMEYIALPPCYSATVWPRFDFVREGIFQSMVKIDPTWYGQLGVALTNVSPAEYPIWKEKRFGTLIIYELSSPTDINLFRKGKTLEPSKNTKKINIPADVENKVNEEIRKRELRGKCIIENGQLVIQTVLDRPELGLLRKLHDSEVWRKAVEEAVRTKSCDALGLPAIDLLLATPTAGEKPDSPKRLTREDVAKEASKCTPEALSKMAVEKGRPFEIIANMPGLAKEQAKGLVLCPR